MVVNAGEWWSTNGNDKHIHSLYSYPSNGLSNGLIVIHLGQTTRVSHGFSLDTQKDRCLPSLANSENSRQSALVCLGSRGGPAGRNDAIDAVFGQWTCLVTMVANGYYGYQWLLWLVGWPQVESDIDDNVQDFLMVRSWWRLRMVIDLWHSIDDRGHQPANDAECSLVHDTNHGIPWSIAMNTMDG